MSNMWNCFAAAYCVLNRSLADDQLFSTTLFSHSSSNTHVSENQIPNRMNSHPVIIRAHHSILDSALYVLPTDFALYASKKATTNTGTAVPTP